MERKCRGKGDFEIFSMIKSKPIIINLCITFSYYYRSRIELSVSATAYRGYITLKMLIFYRLRWNETPSARDKVILSFKSIFFQNLMETVQLGMSNFKNGQ